MARTVLWYAQYQDGDPQHWYTTTITVHVRASTPERAVDEAVGVLRTYAETHTDLPSMDCLSLVAVLIGHLTPEDVGPTAHGPSILKAQA